MSKKAAAPNKEIGGADGEAECPMVEDSGGGSDVSCGLGASMVTDLCFLMLL